MEPTIAGLAVDGLGMGPGLVGTIDRGRNRCGNSTEGWANVTLVAAVRRKVRDQRGATH